MGYRGTVDLVQNTARNLVFGAASIPRSIEVSKGTVFPKDVLRVMDSKIAELLEGTDSEYHRRFVWTCEARGLSLNAAKQLLGSFWGTLRGGELLGKEGVYAHLRKRRRHLQMLSVGLVLAEDLPLVTLQHWAGLAGFVAAYRRPVFFHLAGGIRVCARLGQGPLFRARVPDGAPAHSEGDRGDAHVRRMSPVGLCQPACSALRVLQYHRRLVSGCRRITSSRL